MKCIICNNNPDGNMKFISAADNPNSGYAFNVYHCEYCDTICKEDVWNNPGELWIYYKDNKILLRNIDGKKK